MTTTNINQNKEHIGNVPLYQKPQIKWLPFRYVGAITDIRDNVIWISSLVGKDDIRDVLMDEYAHLASKSGNHGKEWAAVCNELYGQVPKHNPNLDVEKRRFGVPEHMGTNIGNISGIQNMLVDYHLLQHYRKWSQRVLGTEGRWDFVSHNKIRLHPNPKSTFPVIVEYMPKVTEFQSPIARQLAMDMMVAETKIMLGHARRKFASFPAPDGSSITLDGTSLVQEGYDEKEKTRQKAILWGEPLMCHIA